MILCHSLHRPLSCPHILLRLSGSLSHLPAQVKKRRWCQSLSLPTGMFNVEQVTEVRNGGLEEEMLKAAGSVLITPCNQGGPPFRVSLGKEEMRSPWKTWWLRGYGTQPGKRSHLHGIRSHMKIFGSDVISKQWEEAPGGRFLHSLNSGSYTLCTKMLIPFSSMVFFSITLSLLDQNSNS